MHFLSQIFAVFALAVLSFAACASNVLNYYTFDSGDENFKLQWAYNGDDKLIFNVSCKTTGWCAVGFTPIADGEIWRITTWLLVESLLTRHTSG